MSRAILPIHFKAYERFCNFYSRFPVVNGQILDTFQKLPKLYDVFSSELSLQTCPEWLNFINNFDDPTCMIALWKALIESDNGNQYASLILNSLP